MFTALCGRKAAAGWLHSAFPVPATPPIGCLPRFPSIPSEMSATQPMSAPQSSLTLPDAWRVEVFRKPDVDDPVGASLLAAARELGTAQLTGARAGRGTLLPPELDEATVREIIHELLADPVLDDVRLTAPRSEPAVTEGRRRVLVARRAGVMDPVAITISRVIGRAKLAATDLFVSTFTAWELEGDLGEAELETIASKLLANEVIEDVHLTDEALHYGQPAQGNTHGRVDVPLAGLGDDELLRISTEGGLSLNLIEMRTIAAHYETLGRAPSACELETIAQTWSEHCKHKTFAGIVEMREGTETRTIDNLLKSTIKRATDTLDKDWCISVFHDNAGIIAFEDDWDVCFKVETHNHPSAIDPYGGAGTGIGGVIRDILGVGLGARPIANTDAFFVGPLDMPAEDVPKGCMHPRRILRGVVHGVRDYGNRMGIPTVTGGRLVRTKATSRNPLVYAGTDRRAPAQLRATKEVRPGDKRSSSLGGRTGRDGIHGATFSSAELLGGLGDASPARQPCRSATRSPRRSVLDAMLASRATSGLYRAASRTAARAASRPAPSARWAKSAASTVAPRATSRSSTRAWRSHEIWISEAQERMVLAVPPEHARRAASRSAPSEDVEATVLGHVRPTTATLEPRPRPGRGRSATSRCASCTTARRARCAKASGTLRARCADPGCPAAGGPRPPRLHGARGRRPNVAEQASGSCASTTTRCRACTVDQAAGRTEDGDGPGNASVMHARCPDRGEGHGRSVVEREPRSTVKRDPRAHGARGDRRGVAQRRSRSAPTPIARRSSTTSPGAIARSPSSLGALVLACGGLLRRRDGLPRTPFVSGKDSLNNDYRVGDETIARSRPRS